MYPLYSQNNFLRCSVLWQNVIVLLAVPEVLPPKRECKISMFFSPCQVPRRYFFKFPLLIRLICWFSIELINVNLYIIILISGNNFIDGLVHSTVEKPTESIFYTKYDVWHSNFNHRHSHPVLSRSIFISIHTSIQDLPIYTLYSIYTL